MPYATGREHGARPRGGGGGSPGCSRAGEEKKALRREYATRAEQEQEQYPYIYEMGAGL